MNIKKMSFILILSIIVILSGCGQSFDCDCVTCQIESGEDIKIFIAADPHHMSEEIYDDGIAFENFIDDNDCKLLCYSNEIIDGFVQDVKKEKPDIVIIPGDLTGNGARQSHIEFAEKLESIRETGTCVFVVPGNHDVENPWARKYIGENVSQIDSVNPEEFVDIYNCFGYKDALTEDENSLSYLVTPSEDIWLLMLDSAKYKDNMDNDYPEVGGELSTETLKWISYCGDLAEENDAEIIAVMHHSLLDHNEVINKDYTIDNNKRVLKAFQDSNIQIALTGHIHLQDIKSHKEDDTLIYDIGTSSLITYPNQYGILEFLPDKGYEYSTKEISVNSNSLEFESKSKDFFLKQNYNRYYESLLEVDENSPEEIELMAETIALLNSKYFSGFRNEHLDSFKNTKGFKLLENSNPNPVRDYVMSMFDCKKSDNNKLFIPIDLNKNVID